MRPLPAGLALLLLSAGAVLPLAAATVSPPPGYRAPVIAKVQIVFSMVAHHHYLSSRIGQYGGSAGHTRYAVPHLVYEPVVTVANPGSGVLDLAGEDAPRVRVWDPPVGFRFKRNSTYLRSQFSDGEFHGLPRFQVATENNPNARKSFILQLGDMSASGVPARRLTLEAGRSLGFAPWVESHWNWEMETAVGFVPYAFYDWKASDAFTWRDPRAAVAEFGVMGFFCTPGWETRAGFQTDHLGYSSSGSGWISLLLTETVSVESRALRMVNSTDVPDFQIDLLRGNSADGSLSTIQELKISLADLVQPSTAVPTDPTAAATFTVGDILQTPADMTPGGKSPFAVLTLIAKPASLRDGSLQQLGTIGDAQRFYDLRFDPIDSFDDVATIGNLTPVPDVVTILRSHRGEDSFSIAFATPAGAGSWKAVGGSTPGSMTDDLSSRTTFTQDATESHLRTAHIDISGLGPVYFVRLEEITTP